MLDGVGSNGFVGCGERSTFIGDRRYRRTNDQGGEASSYEGIGYEEG